MTINATAIVIIAPAGRLCDSLRVLFKSTCLQLPIQWADRLTTVLPRLAGGPPVLLLLDAALLDDQAWQLLDDLRRDSPQHHYVILAHSAEQQRQAQTVGIRAIGLERLTAASLLAAADE